MYKNKYSIQYLYLIKYHGIKSNNEYIQIISQ